MTNPNEHAPQELSSEAQAEEEMLQQWMKDHPEVEVPAEARRESGPEIVEFEQLVVSFESTHSLEKLHSIVDLTPELGALFKGDRDMSVEQRATAVSNLTSEDAEKYRTRTAARKDLEDICAMKVVLKEETNIAPEKYRELKAAYVRLTRAVGIINNNVVDHERKFDLDT